MNTVHLLLLLITIIKYWINAEVSIIGAKLTANSGAIVQETGGISIEFSPSGITYQTGDIISIVFASGTSISTSSPIVVSKIAHSFTKNNSQINI